MAAPTLLLTPFLDGLPIDGGIVNCWAENGDTAAPGGPYDFFSNAPTSYTYQWQTAPDGSSWTNIGGATSKSYTIPDDGSLDGLYLRCTVEASNVDGLIAVSTSPMGKVGGPRSWADRILSTGPYAWYRLSDATGPAINAEGDASLDGTYNGTVNRDVIGLLPLDSDGCVRLFGTDGYISTPAHTSGTKWTAMVLFNTDTVAGVGGFDEQVMVAEGDYGWRLQLFTDVVLFTFNTSGSAGNLGGAGLSTIVAGTTYVAMVVVDGATAKLYLNGVLADSHTFASDIRGSLFDDTSNVSIGRAPGGTYLRPFEGLLDEAVLWNRALTVDEALAIATGSTTDTSGKTPTISDVPGSYPVLSGAVAVGSTLTCTSGTWYHSPTTYWYTFLRPDGTVVQEASASDTYVTVAGDIGHKIRCSVQAVNGDGAAAVFSNFVGPITGTIGGGDTGGSGGGDSGGTDPGGTTPGGPDPVDPAKPAPGSTAWTTGTEDLYLTDPIGALQVWICDKLGDPFMFVSPDVASFDMTPNLDGPVALKMGLNTESADYAQPGRDGYDLFDYMNVVKIYSEEGHLLAAFNIWDVSDTDDDSGRVTELLCYSPLYWTATDRFVLTEDSTATKLTTFPVPGTTGVWNPTLVIKELVRRAIAVAPCGLTVEGGTFEKQVNPDGTLTEFVGEWDPFTMLADAIPAVTNTYGGCDIAERFLDRYDGVVSELSAYAQYGNRREHALFARTREGVSNCSSMMRVKRGVNVVNWMRGTGSQGANGSLQPNVLKSSSDSISRFGRHEGTDNFPAPKGSALTLMVTEELRLRQEPQHLYSLTPDLTAPQPYRDFRVGDIVPLACDHRGGYDGDARVYAFTISLDPDTGGYYCSNVLLHAGDQEGFSV